MLFSYASRRNTKEVCMRMYASAIATVVALFALSVPAFSQAAEIAPGGPDEAPLSQGRSVAQPDACGQLQEACFDEEVDSPSLGLNG
jgi:hypothetical protein